MKQAELIEVDLHFRSKMIHVPIPGGMKPAHGSGIDEKTQVKSLSSGSSPDHPGRVFVQDVHGNVIITTSDEVCALLRQLLGHTHVITITRR